MTLYFFALKPRLALTLTSLLQEINKLKFVKVNGPAVFSRRGHLHSFVTKAVPAVSAFPWEEIDCQIPLPLPRPRNIRRALRTRR